MNQSKFQRNLNSFETSDMIKHGSGMASCLKYVTSRVPSVVPLVVRHHVSVCSRQISRHSVSSPLLQETNGRGEFPSSTLPLDHQTFGSTTFKQGKTLTVHCDSDVIRYISYLIFDCEDNRTSSIRLPTTLCQCATSSYGVPNIGTPVDFKSSVVFNDPKYSQFDIKKHKETALCNSRSDDPNLSSGNKLTELHLKQLNSSSNTKSEDPFQPPSEGQLDNIVQTLSTDLPNFFTRFFNIKIYHPNIILEDNIRGRRFSGRDQYNLQAKLLYLIGHLRFLFIRLDVLKITAHPEDGTVKVRWKINVIRLSKIFRIKFWDLAKYIQESEQTWIDGFSTYYVKGDGLVHKHVADKMIPDPHQIVKKSESAKPPIVPQPLAYSDRNKM